MKSQIESKDIRRWHLNEITQIVNEFEADICAYIQRAKPKDAKNYENILLNTCGKAIVTIREIIVLCFNGYPDGALSLARNLYEQMIILAFFEQKMASPEFNTIIDNYFIDYEVQELRALRYYYDLMGVDSEKECISQRLEKIKAAVKKEIKGSYWWAELPNFSKIVEVVIQAQKDISEKNLISCLHLQYKQACVVLHASCMGNSIRIGMDSPSHIINTAPNYDGQAIPLFFAVASFVFIVGSSCRLFGVDYNKYRRRLNNICISLQKRI